MRDNPVSVDVTIRADFDRMRGFAHRLRELARELGNQSGFVHCQALDHDLAGHLYQTENDWARHHSRLQSFVAETATAIERIVAQYEKTNDTVAAAATSR